MDEHRQKLANELAARMNLAVQNDGKIQEILRKLYEEGYLTYVALSARILIEPQNNAAESSGISDADLEAMLQEELPDDYEGEGGGSDGP